MNPPPFPPIEGPPEPRSGSGRHYTSQDRDRDLAIVRRHWWGKLLVGFNSDGRILRYILVLALGLILFGGIAGLYYVATPKSYTSGFTLILPGTGPGASVNLESLGQASSASSSPFSSPNLSPTQNYKRLLMSFRVRSAAAELSGVPFPDYPEARIRLVDMTPLIFVEMSGPSPEAAQTYAQSLLTVFQQELDALRAEELETRDESFEDTLTEYEANVLRTREAIMVFQAESGLVSLDQFQALLTGTGGLEDSLEDALDQARAKNEQAAHLSELIDIPEDIAAHVLILRGDPQFEALRQELARVAASIAEYRRIYGANHPEMRAMRENHAGLLSAMGERGEALLGVAGYRMLRLAEINMDEERAGLLRQLVLVAAEAAGKRAEAQSLRNRLTRNQDRIQGMSAQAARLDALQRDHQVAETVFASALARYDTARSDFYSSYPLTQILEDPGLPEKATSPSKKIAVLAAGGGFFLYLMGVILLWLRLPLIRALWKIV